MRSLTLSFIYFLSSSALGLSESTWNFARRYGSRITVLAATYDSSEQVRKAVEARVAGRAAYEFKAVRLDGFTSPANEVLKELGTGKYDAGDNGGEGAHGERRQHRLYGYGRRRQRPRHSDNSPLGYPEGPQGLLLRPSILVIASEPVVEA